MRVLDSERSATVVHSDILDDWKWRTPRTWRQDPMYPEEEVQDLGAISSRGSL